MPTLNVRLAAIIMISLIVLGGGVHLLHGFQVGRQASALKTASEKYEEESKEALKSAESIDPKEKDPQKAEDRKAALTKGEKDRAEAIRLLRDYVRLVPHDRGAEIKLAFLFIEARQLKPAYDFLEDALRLADKSDPPIGKDPEEVAKIVRDARLRLVKDVTMKIGPAEAMKAHLEILLEGTLDENKRRKRNGQKPEGDAELLDLYGVSLVYSKSEKEACEFFQDAITIAPDRVDSYLNLASVMRRSLRQEVEADAVIDAMIAKNPKSVPAYEKYVSYYLGTGKKEKIDKAFSKARELLKLAPNDPRGLLLMGRCYIVRQEPEKAEEYLRKGIKASKETDDVAGWYKLLADAQQSLGKFAQTLATLKEGVEATRGTPGNLELLWSLADAQILDKQFKEAEPNMKLLREGGYPPNLIDFLEVRIAIDQQNWSKAEQLLRDSVIPHTTDAANAGLRYLALVYLAQCYQQRNADIKSRIVVLEQATKLLPTQPAARNALADIYMSLGRINDALEQYDWARKGSQRDAAEASMVRASIVKLLQTPETAEKKRDWTPVENMLNDLIARKSTRPELLVLMAELMLAEGKSEAARDALEKSVKEVPKGAEAWLALVRLDLHEAENSADAAKQADHLKKAAVNIDRAEKALGDRFIVRMARGSLALASKDPLSIGDALKKLGENTDALNDVEKLQLWSTLGGMCVQANEVDLGRMYFRRVAEKEPKNIRARSSICELDLRASEKGQTVDMQELDRLIDDLEHLEGPGPDWYYTQAIRAFIQAKNKDPKLLNDARGYLIKALKIRGDWAAPFVLAAKICDLQEEDDQAVDLYMRAFFLGERNSDVIGRTVRLLVPRRRLDEARVLFDILEKQKSGLVDEMHQDYVLVSIFGCKDEDIGKAEKMVEQSVAADSKNAKDLAWQGQLYAYLTNRLKAAAQKKADPKTPNEWLRDSAMLAMARRSWESLYKAKELNPQAEEVWVGLAQLLSDIGQTQSKNAAPIIEEAERQLKSDKALFTVGLCCELLGQPEKAEQKYQAAVKASPQNTRFIRNLANFYLRTGKASAAEPLLNEIIKLQSPATLVDVCWARRNLANMVKGRDYEGLRQALALLDENLASNAATIDDKRMKVRLLIADPRKEKLADALAGMEDLVKAPDATADDRYTLAQLYLKKCDSEADPALKTRYMGAYEEQMHVVLGAKRVQSRFLISYIIELMDRKEYEDADRWIGTLEKAMHNPRDPDLKIQIDPLPDPFESMRIRAEYLYRRGQYRELGDKAESYIYNLDPRSNDRGQQLLLTAGLLESCANRLKADHQPDIAAEFMSKAEKLFDSLRSGKLAVDGWVFYTSFLARQGRIDEALAAIDQSWDRSQPDLVQLPAFAVIKCSATKPQQFARLEKMLSDAQKAKPSSSLLMVLTGLYEQQRQYDKAIATYREILSKEPKNFKVLNNSAVDLVHIDGDLDEALAMVNRALEVTGPMAAVLDSRAMVYIARKEYDKALGDLNAAIRDEGSAEQYFHLAWVLSLLDRKDDASAAFKTAQSKNLDPKLLNEKEVRVYDRLKDSL
jgi:tetratricopeptide (TPR) repeat protein